MEEVKGIYLVTADHGNAEDMVQRDKKTKRALMAEGKPRMLTSHTLNPVSPHPCLIFSSTASLGSPIPEAFVIVAAERCERGRLAPQDEQHLLRAEAVSQKAEGHTAYLKQP